MIHKDHKLGFLPTSEGGMTISVPFCHECDMELGDEYTDLCADAWEARGREME